MYEYLLFELKSEHVFSMPGFGHVAMGKKYTISSIWPEKWMVSQKTPPHRPQIHQQPQNQLPRQRRTFFFQGRVGTRQIDKFWQKIVSANHLPYSPSIHIYTLSSKPEPCQDLPKAKGKQAEDTKEAAILGMGSNMFQLFLFPLLSSIWTDICGYRIRGAKFVKDQSFQNKTENIFYLNWKWSNRLVFLSGSIFLILNINM